MISVAEPQAPSPSCSDPLVRFNRGRVGRLFAFLTGMLLIAIGIHALHLVMNTTSSMPVGFYNIQPVSRPVAAGDIVDVCPPFDAAVLAARRNYLVRGSCGGSANQAPPLPTDPDQLQIYSASIGPDSSPSQRSEALNSARVTRFDEMSQASMKIINANPTLKSIVQEAVNEQRDGLELQQDQQLASGMQGIAMAVPRDSAPPSAAQIRLSNPDRL